MFVSGYMELQNRDGRWDFFYFIRIFYLAIKGGRYVRIGKSSKNP